MSANGYEARWSRRGGGEARSGRCLTPTMALVEAAMAEDAHERARVYAVAEDGIETPLPTYEEVLAERERILAMTEAFQFASEDGVRNPIERIEMLLASRNDIARERDEARAATRGSRAFDDAMADPPYIDETT